MIFENAVFLTFISLKQKLKSYKMFLFRFYKNLLVIKFAKSDFFIRSNSMKPFHCTGSACDGQSLFGECSISHPFVFDDGKQCCNTNLDAEDKARN